MMAALFPLMWNLNFVSAPLGCSSSLRPCFDFDVGSDDASVVHYLVNLVAQDGFRCLFFFFDSCCNLVTLPEDVLLFH